MSNTTNCYADSAHQVDQDDQSAQKVVNKIAQYQNNIKLPAVILATALACALVEMRIEFVYTLPLLLVVPFICRLWYKKSLPILAAGIVSSVPFAYYNLYQPEQVLYFAISSIVLGVGAAALYTWSQSQGNSKVRIGGIAGATILLAGGCIASFVIAGSPIEYVKTYQTVNAYMDDKYGERPEVTFLFKGVKVSELWTQSSPCVTYLSLDSGYEESNVDMMVHEGSIIDYYEWDVLTPRFNAEQSYLISPYILAAVDFVPTDCGASFDDRKGIQLREEYLNSYAERMKLPPVFAKEKQQAQLAMDVYVTWTVPYSEEERYLENGAKFSDNGQYFSKEEFIARAKAIYENLTKYDVAYHEVSIKAGLDGKQDTHTGQAISFFKGDSLEKMLGSYIDLE